MRDELRKLLQKQDYLSVEGKLPANARNYMIAQRYGSCDLDFNLMTSTKELDLDILKMYLRSF